MRLFDTHAHIGLITEDPIEQLLTVQEAKQESVEGIVSICNNLRDFYQIYPNLKSEESIYHSIGVSPSEVAHPGEDWEAKVSEGARLERVVAVGEIGLDYYHDIGQRAKGEGWLVAEQEEGVDDAYMVLCPHCVSRYGLEIRHERNIRIPPAIEEICRAMQVAEKEQVAA